MTKYNKLVRDRIPEILDGKGVSYEKRVADDAEYKSELIKKLGEEVEEFMAEGSPEELADVLEVTESLLKLADYKETEKIKLEKKEKRGGFDKKIILKGDK